MNKQLTTEEFNELNKNFLKKIEENQQIINNLTKEEWKEIAKRRVEANIFDNHYSQYIFNYFYYDKFKDLTNEQLISAASSYATNIMFKNKFLENNTNE
jgi:hypothetical protein